MKKVLSLILAVAMVLSLASVAFAAVTATPWTDKTKSSSTANFPVTIYDNEHYFIYDGDTHLFTPYSYTKSTTFGKTLYLPLLVAKTDPVSLDVNGDTITMTNADALKAGLVFLSGTDGYIAYNDVAVDVDSTGKTSATGETEVTYDVVNSTRTDYFVAKEDKAVSSLKLAYTVEQGAAFVKGVDIVKKYGASTYASANGCEYAVTNTDNHFLVSGSDRIYLGYKTKDKPDTVSYKGYEPFSGYYIAVDTQGTSTKDSEPVSIILSLTGKSGDNKFKDETIHFDFALAWVKADATDGDYTKNSANTGYAIKAKEKAATRVIDAAALNDTDNEFKFGTDGEVTFTVDMALGEKVIMKYSEKAIKAIEDANEEAGIAFYNFNGATFKRTGDLVVEADMEDEDVYFYEVLADGSLKNLTSLYDEEEGGFVLKVKKLGQYCVSDLPLVDAEGTVAAVAGAVNPTTGAIA